MTTLWTFGEDLQSLAQTIRDRRKNQLAADVLDIEKQKGQIELDKMKATKEAELKNAQLEAQAKEQILQDQIRARKERLDKENRKVYIDDIANKEIFEMGPNSVAAQQALSAVRMEAKDYIVKDAAGKEYIPGRIYDEIEAKKIADKRFQAQVIQGNLSNIDGRLKRLKEAKALLATNPQEGVKLLNSLGRTKFSTGDPNALVSVGGAKIPANMAPIQVSDLDEEIKRTEQKRDLYSNAAGVFDAAKTQADVTKSLADAAAQEKATLLADREIDVKEKNAETSAGNLVVSQGNLKLAQENVNKGTTLSAFQQAALYDAGIESSDGSFPKRVTDIPEKMRKAAATILTKTPEPKEKTFSAEMQGLLKAKGVIASSADDLKTTKDLAIFEKVLKDNKISGLAAIFAGMQDVGGVNPIQSAAEGNGEPLVKTKVETPEVSLDDLDDRLIPSEDKKNKTFRGKTRR